MLHTLDDRKSHSRCSQHGEALKRQTCRECRALYMREYQFKRRKADPAANLLRRAKERAVKTGIPFDLTVPPPIPPICPALGLKLTSGGSRQATSPALDRVHPVEGYVTGNVRVISDRANRLKGNHTLQHLRTLAQNGPERNRREFALLARYVEREELLKTVRIRAASGPGNRVEWAKVGDFLERAYNTGACFNHGAA